MGEETAGGGRCGEGSKGAEMRESAESMIRRATALARENKIRYMVRARRWDHAGWIYYVVAAGSQPARALRTWRVGYEAARRG